MFERIVGHQSNTFVGPDVAGFELATDTVCDLKQITMPDLLVLVE